ncbi:MAG: flagellar biosynthetic protein FliO [Puniceicoccales bacterium]|jgi:flagellar biogenesis protein FliO|nr:flagellar biosynthetic protein FliO [Puniceicoccales bacterium]
MLEEVVKSVVFIVLLALGGYFFVLFRRKGWFFPQVPNGDRSHPDHLCVTERLSVGGRHYVAIIQCNGQKFLVGISPNSITSLGALRPSHRDNKDKFQNENLVRWKNNQRTSENDVAMRETPYLR